MKSPFGYHIIQVQAHDAKTLADAKADIEKKIRPEIAKKEVEALQASATVQIDDAYFGPPQPAAPAPVVLK